MTTCEVFDDYLAERTGNYDYRSVRYSAAYAEAKSSGLDDNSTLLDVGAGWTEFDFYARNQGWRGRYIPLDGGIDGTDLNWWEPKRTYDHVVALEILEHLAYPERLINELKPIVTGSIVVSVPNPRTVDVLGIDDTHVRIVTREMLEGMGFRVEERTFYGGVFSNGEPDSLLGVWRA